MQSIRWTICLAVALASPGHASTTETPHWGYSGAGSPEHWSQLAPENSACKREHQSPIDLTGFIEAELPPVGIEYSADGRELWNNGHTVQLDFDAGSSISVDGVSFELKQLHFHLPSENRIDGKAFPMEAHLVHADKDGHLAVIAVMFEQGSENEALAGLWPLMPEAAGARAKLGAAFSAGQLLPESRDYYRYDGSLTTPPCTEGVRWLVMKHPIAASREQVERLSHVLHHPNNRPIQPLNARAVLQ